MCSSLIVKKATVFLLLSFTPFNITSEETNLELHLTLNCDYGKEYLLTEKDQNGQVIIFRQRSKTSDRYYIKGNFETVDARQSWSFIDWVELSDCYGDGKPHLADYFASDEDHNGFLEFYITYILYPDVTDCCNPAAIKTLVYEYGDKYAIRGKTKLSDDAWTLMLNENVRPYPGMDRGGQMSINGKNSLLNANKPLQEKAIAIFQKLQ